MGYVQVLWLKRIVIKEEMMTLINASDGQYVSWNVNHWENKREWYPRNCHQKRNLSYKGFSWTGLQTYYRQFSLTRCLRKLPLLISWLTWKSLGTLKCSQRRECWTNREVVISNFQTTPLRTMMRSLRQGLDLVEFHIVDVIKTTYHICKLR